MKTWWRNLKISVKMFLAFLVVILAMCIMVATSITNLTRVLTEVNVIENVAMPVLGETTNALNHWMDLRLSVRNAQTYHGNSSQLDATQKHIFLVVQIIH